MNKVALQYTVVLEQTPNNWGAYVPDVGGCIAVGDTREEVLRNIREALEFHFEGLVEENLAIPTPGTWTDLVEVTVAEAAIRGSNTDRPTGRRVNS